MQAYPGARALIIRATRASLTNTVLVTFEKQVLGPNHPLYSGSAQRPSRRTYRYPNGSEIDVAGMDKPDKVLSSEYDIIYVPEAVELLETDWDTLITRLRNGRTPYQQIVADTNPSHPQHWLKKRCNEGQAQLISGRHEDNPRLFDPVAQTWTAQGEAYLKKLDALKGVLRDRFLLGKWTQAEGAVYDEFDESVHVIKPFEISKKWDRYRAVDFGYNNPFVCLWAARDPDGNFYVYRELYRTRGIVEDHAREIKALSEGETYVDTIADHDAEDRATLERHGITTNPADKEVSAGINMVKEFLRIQGNGKPRLFIFADTIGDRRDPELESRKVPTCLLEEFPAYVWSRTTDGRTSKEQPVKEFDHALDALRYLLFTVGDAPTWEGLIA